MHRIDDVLYFTSEVMYNDELSIQAYYDEGGRAFVGMETSENQLHITTSLHLQLTPVCERNTDGMYTRSHNRAQLITVKR